MKENVMEKYSKGYLKSLGEVLELAGTRPVECKDISTCRKTKELHLILHCSYGNNTDWEYLCFVSNFFNTKLIDIGSDYDEGYYGEVDHFITLKVRQPVMPIYKELAGYITKFGKLTENNQRIVKELMEQSEKRGES